MPAGHLFGTDDHTQGTTPNPRLGMWRMRTKTLIRCDIHAEVCASDQGFNLLYAFFSNTLRQPCDVGLEVQTLLLLTSM